MQRVKRIPANDRRSEIPGIQSINVKAASAGRRIQITDHFEIRNGQREAGGKVADRRKRSPRFIEINPPTVEGE